MVGKFSRFFCADFWKINSNEIKNISDETTNSCVKTYHKIEYWEFVGKQKNKTKKKTSFKIKPFFAIWSVFSNVHSWNFDTPTFKIQFSLVFFYTPSQRCISHLPSVISCNIYYDVMIFFTFSHWPNSPYN